MKNTSIFYSSRNINKSCFGWVYRHASITSPPTQTKTPQFQRLNFRILVSLGLLHGCYKGCASSSAAAEHIVSTEEDTDEILELVHNLNKEINLVETKSNDLDNLKQPELVKEGKICGAYADIMPESLKNEYEFQHSKVSQFVIAHSLASQRRLKSLRSSFIQMLQQDGAGSGPSNCELLSSQFKGWDANEIVWDMLAFAYAKLEMVHDALYVIAKMKDLNIQPSILTYNSLLYNLRHSNIILDVYNDIKESGVHTSKQTNSILIDALCKQSMMQ